MQRRRRLRAHQAIRFGWQGHARAHRGYGLVLVDSARRPDDEVRQPVVGVGVLEDVVAGQAGDRLLCAGDVSSQRMFRPDHLFQQVQHVVLGLVLIHLQLLQDHHPLTLHIVRRELRVRHDVGKDVEPELEVLGRNAGPVRGQLLVGGRIYEAANAFDGVGYLFRRWPPARALEQEMLDEMRDARQPVVLESRASAEHEHQAGGEAFRHRSHDQPRPS